MNMNNLLLSTIFLWLTFNALATSATECNPVNREGSFVKTEEYMQPDQTETDDQFIDYLINQEHPPFPDITLDNAPDTIYTQCALSRNGIWSIMIKSKNENGCLIQEGFYIQNIETQKRTFYNFTGQFHTKTVGSISLCQIKNYMDRGLPLSVDSVNGTFIMRNTFDLTAISNDGSFIALATEEDAIYVLKKCVYDSHKTEYVIDKEFRLRPHPLRKPVDELLSYKLLDLRDVSKTEAHFIKSIHFNNAGTTLGIVLTENGQKIFNVVAKLAHIKEENQS
jgi:hypothetical protein